MTVKDVLEVSSEEYKAMLKKFGIATKIYKLQMKENIFRMKVKLSVKDTFHIKGAILSLKHKSKVDEIPIRVSSLNRDNTKVLLEVDVAKCNFQKVYWNIFIVLKIGDEETRVRPANASLLIMLMVTADRYNYKMDDGYFVYPHIMSDRSVGLAYRELGEYETDVYKQNEKKALLKYILGKPLYDRKKIWLVHEKFSETAQDNSYYFFKYCYEHHKNQNVYYVIKKNSSDYENLKGMEDRVLHFMSVKHLIYLCAAKMVISSEAKSHCYAWQVKNSFVRVLLQNKNYVFLQHGVIALKKIDMDFGRSVASSPELFVVSSKYEREIIHHEFGYDYNDILLTGLCRWDVLEDQSYKQKQKNILVLPTWRNWLNELSDEEFIRTDYFKEYMGLLNSKRLQKLLEAHSIRVDFYVHPKFQKYVDTFHTKLPNVRIIKFGEEKVNHLLMNTSLLITDYSSVAWDAYYQHKPVIFYQFDIDMYNQYQGSYLNMETEIFGDVMQSNGMLLNTIEEYIASDFKEKSQYAKLRASYFEYNDRNNSERVYDEIVKHLPVLYQSKMMAKYRGKFLAIFSANR